MRWIWLCSSVLQLIWLCFLAWTQEICNSHFEKKNLKTRTFLLNFGLFWLVQIVRLLGSLRILLRHFLLILSNFYLKVRKKYLLLRTGNEITKKYYNIRRRPSRGVLDFTKTVLQLYWNRTSSWVFSCKFATYFQNTFS